MLQQLMNGVALGSVYALVALGYALVFGIQRIVNLAYGEIMMVGSFAALAATERFGPSLPVGFFFGILGSTAAGLAVHILAVRPLGTVSDERSPSHLAALITTIGAAIFLQNLILKI